MIDRWAYNYDAKGKIRLAFGVGPLDLHDKGYINVDIRPASHIDIQCDLSKSLPMKDNYADEILAHSLLEHFPMGDFKHDEKPYANTIRILKEWRRVLKVGGVLELRVPNTLGLVNSYLNKGMDIIEFFRYLYGAQSYPENTHLAGFDRKTMTFALTLAEFDRIEYIHSYNDNDKFDELTDWEMRVRCTK